MTDNALPPPVWVDQPETLHRMVNDLLKFSHVAVDTESNSLFAYREQVCLIQFSTPSVDYLVDPLALADLSALAPLFASREIEKIFHAAEYDLICLKRDFSFEFHQIFDTMQAARILGRKKIGLGDILEEEFGIKLEKRYQRANWGERPLSPAMLSYARLDTHYLIQLRNRLAEELEKRRLMLLAQEDFDYLARNAAPNPEPQPLNAWRIGSGKDLTPQQHAILQALIEYRDQQARLANLPPFKILPNEVLIRLSETAPQSTEDLFHLQLLSPVQWRRHAAGVIQAIRSGLHTSPPPRNSNHRPDEHILERMELLKEWRKKTARQMGVESDVILPRSALEKIAFASPTCRADLDILMKDFPWRREKFGNQIWKILQKGN